MKVYSLILSSLLATLLITTGALALAQTSTDTTSTEVTAQDLGTSDQIVLSDSPLYFLKDLLRKVQLTLTFNDVAKADLENQFTNEKLVELKQMTEKSNTSPEALKKATQRYQDALNKLKDRVNSIKNSTATNASVNKFIEKYTNQQVLQEKILQKLETQVPQAVSDKIKEAREQHLERFKEIMTRLENNNDKIAEKIKNALENANEADSEILEKIKEKMPEDLKAKLDSIKEGVRARVNAKLIEKSVEKNIDKNCTTISKPAEDFCQNGIVKIERDQKGCATGFSCSTPFERPEQKFCTMEYNPVCGTDGKTYGNRCVAQNAGVTAAYQGECSSEKACTTDSDCPTIYCIKAPCPVNKCTEGKCKITETKENEQACQDLWWYDKDHKECSQKKFCGLYMYEGLQTFRQKDACEAQLNAPSNL